MTPSPSDESVRSRLGRHAMPLLLIALSIAAAYSSTWSSTFGFMDDYNITFNEAHGNHRILATCIEQGRPLDGVILDVVFSRIHHITTISHARELSQLFIVLAAVVFYAAMIRSGWPRAISAALAIVCGTLPAMQVYASWGIEVAQPLAVMAAGIAALLAASSGDGFTANSVTMSPVRMMRVKWWPMAGACVSLLAALLIYQPAAMTFWAFVAIDLLRPDRSRNSSRADIAWSLARFAGVIAVALAGARIALWYGLHHQIPRVYAGESAAQRATFIGFADIPAKLRFFLDVIGMSLNLTNIVTNTAIAKLVAALIVGGLPICLWKTSRRWDVLVVLLILLPLSYLPNLLVKDSWPAFRTQMGIESLIAVCLIVSLQGWWWIGADIFARPDPWRSRRWLPMPLLALISTAAVLSAGYFVTVYFVQPQTVELRLAASLLDDQQLAGATRIELIGADWSDAAAPAVYFEEFGQPSSYRPWGGLPMIRLLLAAGHPQYRDLPVVFVSGDLPHLPGSIIIDMRTLRQYRNANGG